MDDIKKLFRKNLGRQMKIVKDHFQKDKWPLSVQYIASEAVHDTLGLDSWVEVIHVYCKPK